MDDVKAKLNAMREKLDTEEKREEIAKLKARDSRERMARAEDAIATLKRKITIVQMDLKKVDEQTDLKLDRVERLNRHIFENETYRRQLERNEMKEDNTLECLESKQKSQRLFVEEAEQRCHEASNKLRMLEAQTEKVDAKIQTAKSKERYFAGRLNDADRTAGSLTRSGESKQAKCDEYHEKCQRLSEKKERALIAAECLERKAWQLEACVASLRVETRETKNRELNAKRELRDIMNEVNTYP